MMDPSLNLCAASSLDLYLVEPFTQLTATLEKRIMIQISVCKCDCVTPEVGGRSQQAFISTTKAHFTVQSFHTIWSFNPISAQSLHRGTACHSSLEEFSSTTLISCSIKHVMSCNHFTAKYGRGFVTP